jgi:hypothetical protein
VLLNTETSLSIPKGEALDWKSDNEMGHIHPILQNNPEKQKTHENRGF